MTHADDSDDWREPSSVLFGRFMLPDTSEYPCQVTDMTPEGAVFLTSATPPAGLAIVAYIDEIGRIEAVTGPPVEGGLAVIFQLTGARRERIESRIRWLQGDAGPEADQRRFPRYEPRDSQSHMTLPDGRVYACEVIDISIGGAVIKTDVMPALGTYLLLGKMRGRVVRYLDNGIAIEFTKQLDRTQLSEHVR